MPRLWRSPWSNFNSEDGDLSEETITANAVYTDERLAEIARNGFNAIWVHALLHHVVASKYFPEFGTHANEHVGNLNALVQRAAQHGLQVYIYMQPPRGFDQHDPIWAAHPQTRGAGTSWINSEGEKGMYYAMCTSHPKVKKYIYHSTRDLFRRVKGLGGAILITASEHTSHCYANYPAARYQENKVLDGADKTMFGDAIAEALSRGEMPPLGCARCEQRTPWDVVGEIVKLVRDGAKAASPGAQIIAWNWSWSFYEKDPSPNVLKALPDDVILMADFERGDTKEILGKVRAIDEYSLSFAGPSKRFRDSYKIAIAQKRQVIAKLQLGTTHELGTVPNLPVIGNLYEKARQMRRLRVEGFMGCWCFGNMPSANTAAFNYFLNASRLPSRQKALRAFAKEYFIGADAALVAEAWEGFAAAMDSYPFSVPFIYTGPVNYALAYPLLPGPLEGTSTGYSCAVSSRGDDLSACLHPYTLAEVIRGFRQLCTQWKQGAQSLEKGLRGYDGEHARQELANAWVCHHIFVSTLHAFQIYKLRLAWSDDQRPRYRKIISAELKNIKSALAYVEADGRFGWHAEPQAYLFDAESIKRKIRQLEEQLRN